MNADKLKKIVELHGKWARGESGGGRANLRGANLRDANLRDADLRGANLLGANGNLKEMKSIFLDRWPVTYTTDRIQIGCQNNSIEEWRGFDDEKIADMDEDALKWWHKWKDFIFQAIEMSPSNPTSYVEKKDE